MLFFPAIPFARKESGMPLRLRARRGFTLIELLVVIAIIAILIGLLVPAVQKVREAAARAQCQSQLKQLALACHTYHDSYKVLPQNYGGNLGWGNGNLTQGSWSWIAMILPYIEQAALYNNGNIGAKNGNGAPTTTWTNAGGQQMAQAQIPILRCPSDPDYRQMLFTSCADVGGGPYGGLSISNYKGVCGANWEWGNALWNPGWLGANNGMPGTSFTTPSGQTQYGLDAGNGVLWRSNGPGGANQGGFGATGQQYTLLSIRDGTSNTFMLGEDLPSHSQWCGAWFYANNVSGTCAMPPNNYVDSGTADWPDNYGFASGHNGGLNFAMCDGSVQFISNNITSYANGPNAPGVYQALATRSGGETVNIDNIN
jgi:prepilin-type N-terminal cleavage/methylation domain-containing protein/prepilin-type processing-associated H-X9-DG protein